MLARASAGVGRMITIWTEIEKFPPSATSPKATNVFCSVGTHPNHALDEREFSADEIAALAAP